MQSPNQIDGSPQPLVSIIIPSYNHSRYVVQAVESVISQTISLWELIIVDDGSTDNSVELLRSHPVISVDARIQIHVQENGGSHAAINRGLALARGKYLTILNSDDLFAPERLEVLLTEAERMDGDCFMVTALRAIDENGAELDANHWWRRMYRDIVDQWHASESTFASGRKAFLSLLWGNFTVSTSNFFLSRSLLHRLGNLRPYRYVLDWEYALRVALKAPEGFRFLADHTLLDYRLHGANTILSGALINHVEAARMLRQYHGQAARMGIALSERSSKRLYYLNRFIRQEYVRAVKSKQNEYWQHELAQVQARFDNSRNECAALAQEVAHVRTEKALLQQELRELRMSTSWQITAPLRKVMRLAKKVRRHSANAFSNPGAVTLADAPTYDRWLAEEEKCLVQAKRRTADRIRALGWQPLVTVVMKVNQASSTFLLGALESLRAQSYPKWELCIDHAFTQEAIAGTRLGQLLSENEEIRVISAKGITDLAGVAAQVKGEVICQLGQNDLLAPDALLRVVETFNADPIAMLAYSDEDEIDSSGSRLQPIFKPDWSEILYWSQDYVGQLMCIRRAALNEISEGMEVGNVDLVLKLAPHSGALVHIAEVLYHRRQHAATEPGENLQADTVSGYQMTSRAALSNYLQEHHKDCFDSIEESPYPGILLPRFRLPKPFMASLIIPTRDKADLLMACIDSIRDKTQGIDYEIIVIDNGSSEPKTLAYFEQLRTDERIQVIAADVPFNWSRLNNIGCGYARGQMLVFLNNDTMIISPDWLQRLGEYAALPNVGVVGPLLLYPDDTIQHAGVVVGMGGWADHVFKGMAISNVRTPHVTPVAPRNVLAVTGACMAIASDKYAHLGGFDESFEICGSDVELCLRAHNAGLHNVYLPTARLYHLESKTRSPYVPECDFRQSELKYAPYREQGDPYFNPNLDIMSVQPSPGKPYINIGGEKP